MWVTPRFRLWSKIKHNGCENEQRAIARKNEVSFALKAKLWENVEAKNAVKRSWTRLVTNVPWVSKLLDSEARTRTSTLQNQGGGCMASFPPGWQATRIGLKRMHQYMFNFFYHTSGKETRHTVYCCICSNRNRLGFYSEIQIFFGPPVDLSCILVVLYILYIFVTTL